MRRAEPILLVFATVYWIDLFIREDYFQTIIQSLNYCRKQKGMIFYMATALCQAIFIYYFKQKTKTRQI